MQVPIERITTVSKQQKTVAPKAVDKLDRIAATSEKKYQQTENEEEIILGVKEDALKLVCNTVIDHINRQFLNVLGSEPIKKQFDSEFMANPQMMSNKIAQLSIQHYQEFKVMHDHLTHPQAIEEYLNAVNNGIDNGMQEAQDILSNLGSLDVTTVNAIHQTKQLILEKLALFKQLICKQAE